VQDSLDVLPIGKAQLRRRGRASRCSPSARCCRRRKRWRPNWAELRQHALRQAARPRAVLELGAQPRGLVTLEDNAVMGGAGSGVAELLAAEGIDVPVLHLGLPDAYLDHASREDLLAQAGLDVAGVRAAVLARWPELGAGRRARSQLNHCP
jgi:1-deoxy-D-xylulose-5-phosphate synthase